MTDLKNYVDGLFRHQHETPELTDLKEEILSNMIAKRDDLIAQGLDKSAATERAKESLSSIDGLVDGNQLTRVGRYHAACLQSVLLGCIVFWIGSMPLLFCGVVYAAISDMGLLLTLLSGALCLARRKKESDTVAFRSVAASRRRGRTAWLVWGLFFLVYTGTMAAVSFGGNIWFGRPLDISGPYQAAGLAARFYLPLLTVIAPLTVGSFTKSLVQSRKEHDDECKA